MKDFFKYLTPSEEDKNWGIYLNVAGKSSTFPHNPYPSKEHPSGYYFTWKRGRVLGEYQLIYISEGAGILENEQGKWDINAGDILLIRPEEYHRYQPDLHKGWVENYIGFQGHLVAGFFKKASFLNSQSYINYGVRDAVLGIYERIFKLVQDEKPGFQQVGAGLVIELLGRMIAHQKRGDFTDKMIQYTIQKILLEIRNNVEQQINLQDLAKRHHLSYASFRKLFKKYTGMSPRQYHLELKVIRAKELILTTDKSIQQISQELHFESIHYFSRYFKKKTGQSPSKLRKGV